jgi:hypothetical protein
MIPSYEANEVLMLEVRAQAFHKIGHSTLLAGCPYRLTTILGAWPAFREIRIVRSSFNVNMPMGAIQPVSAPLRMMMRKLLLHTSRRPVPPKRPRETGLSPLIDFRDALPGKAEMTQEEVQAIYDAGAEAVARYHAMRGGAGPEKPRRDGRRGRRRGPDPGVVRSPDQPAPEGRPRTD